jgi:hypothetical protein
MTRTMDSMPGPIAVARTAYRAEELPFRKLHRLVDVYETLLKYASALAIQSFYAGGLAASFPDVDRLIRDRIARPALGDWARFLREVLRCFAEREADLFCRELFVFHFQRFGSNPDVQKHFADQGASGRLLALRNRLAHGATLPDAESQALLAEYGPDLEKLLVEAAFLADLPLFYVEGRSAAGGSVVRRLAGVDYPSAELVTIAAPSLPVGHVVVHNPATGASMDLHPLLLYVNCTEEIPRWDERHEYVVGRTLCHQRKILFYNDLKSESRLVSLDYRRGHHSRLR